MAKGVIVKALSGFYYVYSDGEIYQCRGRGKMRMQKSHPLVGDSVLFTATEDRLGVVDEVIQRKNSFIRPAVANVDLLVVVASESVPRTDPFLIDRVAAMACHNNCGVVLCINKSDLSPENRLADIYEKAGFPVILTSAVTGEGVDALKSAIKGKISAFTGNSGVGKSSLLNAMDVKLDIQVADVSHKLGRGKHTTRHVELFALGDDTYIADTPGFASFDTDKTDFIHKDELENNFIDFKPYLGDCRFNDCRHLKEPGCKVLEAVDKGQIHPSRHESYARLYEMASQYSDWEVDRFQ